MSNVRRLGEIIVERHLVPAKQVEAVARQQGSGLRLGERLVRLGLISEGDLMRALAHQLKLPILVEIHRAALPAQEH